MPLAEVIENLGPAALLGTERAGPPPQADGPLAGLAARVPATPKERAFLALSAAAFACQRAGAIATKLPLRADPAPADDTPQLSPASAGHLSRMLNDLFPEVLPEFLAAAGSAGRRAPPQHLPALLSLARRDIDLRPLVVAVLGARGLWLAAQNPEWDAPFSAPMEEHFQTGTAAQRRALIASLRQINPARARELLTASWPQEAPDDRAAFIELFAASLSIEDEPFLESALDDKRKEVRTAAAEHLSLLSESRYAARMTARLGPLITASKKLLGKTKVTFAVPENHTPEMARDGIAAKSAFPNLGDKAYHLAMLIGSTPLSFWQNHAGFSPAEALAQAQKSEWAPAVHFGFVMAAQRQRDAALIAAALPYWFTQGKDPLRHLDGWIARLVTALTPTQREAAITPFLADGNLYETGALLEMLQACKHPWSRAFSEKFLPVFWNYIGLNGRGWYFANHALGTDLCLYAHPAILAPINDRLSSETSPRTGAVEKFLSVLQFRHDILKEF